MKHKVMRVNSNVCRTALGVELNFQNQNPRRFYRHSLLQICLFFDYVGKA